MTFRALPIQVQWDVFPSKVRVAADGREGRVKVVYYDRLHTGRSYDQLTVDLDDGSCVRGPANLFEELVSDEPALMVCPAIPKV